MATKKSSRGKQPAQGSTGAKATLSLDAKFYPLPAIDKARQAFSKLAEIEYRKQGSNIVVSFSGMRTGVAGKVPDEFANFALACTVSEP